MDEPKAECKRRTVLRRGVATGALVAGGSTLVGTATARGGKGRGNNHCTLNWGKELNAGQCNGELVINVERKVINGLDTGTVDPWAEDTFRQHIQVWETADGSFCAVLTWLGRFDAFDGATSPGGNCELTGDESGPFEGGVRLTFDGEFAPGGTSTRGFLGTVDQGCEQTTASCDFRSTTGWMSDYFDAVSDLSFEWWGFIYHGGTDGTWVNAIDGDCGDIGCE